MRFSIYFLLAISTFLPSCASVKNSATIVDEVFVNNSDQTYLKSSSLKIFSDRFNQSFFGYNVTDAHDSFVKQSEEKLIATQHTTVKVPSNLVDWLFFDSPYPYPYQYTIENRTYEMQSEASFSFKFTGLQNRTSDVECRRFFLEDSDISRDYESSAKEFTSKDKMFHAQRVSTYLSCTIKQATKKWQFALEVTPRKFREQEVILPLKSNPPATNLLSPAPPLNRLPTFYFPAHQDGWKVKPVTEFYQELSNGKIVTSSDLPPWAGRNIFGFEFYYNDEPLGALSISNKPQVWLSKSASAELREDAMIFIYAIYMFNEVDSGWN